MRTWKPVANANALLALACLLLLSSSAAATPNAGDPGQRGRHTQAIVRQLSLAESNLVSHHLPLRLVGYERGQTLRDDQDVVMFRQLLLDDSNLLPVFDGRNPRSFRLLTVLDLEQKPMLLQGRSSAEDVMIGIEQVVFPLVRTGLSVMDIVWEYQGTQFHSQCLYDKRGVVYDNVLSNIVFVKDRTQEADRADIHPDLVAPNASYTKSKHPVNLNIYWIWGSLRGHIDVYHYAQITDGRAVSQWGSYSGWMTLGTATGSYHDITLTASYAKAQWAYGWATVGMTVRITWNSSLLRFDITITGLGSSGSGQGSDVIYP